MQEDIHRDFVSSFAPRVFVLPSEYLAPPFMPHAVLGGLWTDQWL